jgi:hypothetical protein
VKRQSLAIIVLVSVVALSGCTTARANKSSPTPTAITLTVAQAKVQYLKVVCPANLLIDPFKQALQNSDLPTVQSLGGKLRDAYRNEVENLQKAKWPKEILPETKTLASYDLSVITDFDSISKATSIDSVDAIPFPDSTKASTASQQARLTLGLPADTTAGCPAS